MVVETKCVTASRHTRIQLGGSPSIMDITGPLPPHRCCRRSSCNHHIQELLKRASTTIEQFQNT